MSQFDVIVVGTGAMGSAAAMQLALRGRKVLGIDRYAAGHAHGSSHGETRIIRQAYFEHPSYVPLLLRAYELWHELEQHVGEQLFYQVGLLQAGPADGFVVKGVLQSAGEHQLHVESLSPSQSRQRFPGLVIDPSMACVLEPAAGFLLVERCVRAHQRAAEDAGAVFAIGQVTRIEPTSDGARVWVDGEVHEAAKVVITAGSWADSLLSPIWPTLPKLSVLRKYVCWLRAKSDLYSAASGMPTWLVEAPEGVFYGFPQLGKATPGEGGVKVAEHSGGELVETSVAGPLPASTPVDSRQSRERILGFVRRSMPDLTEEVVAESHCYYTMSADEHFLVGMLPGYSQLIYAAGFSGHGFKFASVMGEVLSDLALDGGSQLPIGWLSHDRFAGSSTGHR